MGPITNHKELIVWRKAIALASKVYDVTRQLPSEERHGLARQLRRSAVSIASNIAEGAARGNRAEYLHFLHIARGALSELETQILIVVEQSYVGLPASGLQELAEVGRLLNALIRSLQTSRQDAHARACSPDATKARAATHPLR